VAKRLLDNAGLIEALAEIDEYYKQNQGGTRIRIEIDYNGGGCRHVKVVEARRISKTETHLIEKQII